MRFTDKGLPKAMVKPNILTHVIEGYVIQEAAEPFAVSIYFLSILIWFRDIATNNQIFWIISKHREDFFHHLLTYLYKYYRH